VEKTYFDENTKAERVTSFQLFDYVTLNYYMNFIRLLYYFTKLILFLKLFTRLRMSINFIQLLYTMSVNLNFNNLNYYNNSIIN